MKYGITLDTGALIAYEREQKFIKARFQRAREGGIRLTVPSIVLAEWWRAGFGRRHDALIESMAIEPTSELAAKAAGVALTLVPSASVVDAIVMASAALRGDVVYTSDLDDLGKLQQHFPGVRVLSASVPQ